MIAAATLIMMAAWGASYSFGIFYKPVLLEFGWTRAETAIAFSLATGVTGIMNAVSGMLSDRFGPRRVLIVLGVLLGTGYMMMPLITNVWHFYLIYAALIGVGMGGAGVPIISNIPRWFAARRGMMSGIVVAGIGLGAVVMPPLANGLIQAYDWRTSYLIVGGVLLLVMLTGSYFMRRGPLGDPKPGDPVDRFSQGSSISKLKSLAGNRQVWLVCGIFICFGWCLMTTMVHLVPHATDQGLTPGAAAGLLAVIGGVSIAGKMAAGWLVDRVGSRKVFLGGFIFLTLGYVVLIFATETWTFYLFAVIFGLAYSGCTVPQAPLVAELFGLRAIGLILGLAVLCLHFSGAAGPYLAGWVFDVSGSYRPAFILLAGLTALGALITILLKPAGTSLGEADQ